MANAVDRAVCAQGGAVVKPHQVKAMVLAARRAYKVQSDAGLVWRRATLHDVVGAAAPDSFRAVTQRDYAAVVEYFGRLAGESLELGAKSLEQKAKSSKLKADDEQRRAQWSLGLVEGETADAFGGHEGARRYADALFARIHKTDRYAATAKQVWAVIFTLRNRAAAVIFTLRNRAAKIRSKTALEARGEAGVHLPLPGASKRFPAFSRGF